MLSLIVASHTRIVRSFEADAIRRPSEGIGEDTVLLEDAGGARCKGKDRYIDVRSALCHHHPEVQYRTNTDASFTNANIFFTLRFATVITKVITCRI
jgi:hypothetical protein